MRKFYIFFIIFFFPFYCFSEDKITIGVSPPFQKNQDVNSIFYYKQFIFEILSLYNSEKYTIEIINVELNDNETIYSQNSIEESRKNNYDYLIYTNVYTINNQLFFKFILKNPYNDVILIDNLFIEKNDFYINEYLTKDTKEILKLIDEKNIQKVKNKKIIKKLIINETELDVSIESRHEVFILNGFFKNNPITMSYLSWYVGYDFVPFNFFNIEACFFWGGGYREDEFNLKSNIVNDFFLGGYGSFHFFLDGVVAPCIGLRFEFGYIVKYYAYFAIPIDLGIKISITQKDSIRINTSFQYTYLNFRTLSWDKGYTLGIMIGYARKI